jgi:hypothetical protein
MVSKSREEGKQMIEYPLRSRPRKQAVSVEHEGEREGGETTGGADPPEVDTKTFWRFITNLQILKELENTERGIFKCNLRLQFLKSS